MQSLHPHLPTSKHRTLQSLAAHPLSERTREEVLIWDLFRSWNIYMHRLRYWERTQVKPEMCFIYTLHTEPEGNFIQSFQRPIFQLWPITRNRCGTFHSQCPVSSQSFRFPMFRVEKLDFYQTSPIHTGARVFLSMEKSKAITRHVHLSRMGPSHRVKERENRTALLCSTQDTFLWQI